MGNTGGSRTGGRVRGEGLRADAEILEECGYGRSTIEAWPPARASPRAPSPEGGAPWPSR